LRNEDEAFQTVLEKLLPLLVAQSSSDKSPVSRMRDQPMPSAIYPSLKGKRVVVTGGASGIGAALVAGFARQGAETIFVDILDSAGRDLVANLGDAAIAPKFHPLDLRDLKAVEEFFRAVGPIDILVNNAASDDRHTLENITPDYWDDRIAVNLRHMLFAAKAAMPGMKARGGGAIINFGSISWHLGLPDLTLYEISKAGIEGMTRALAREFGPDNIRVTCILPGNVKTERQARWYTAEGEKEIIALQSLKTRIAPEQVASLALFLASDDGCMCTGHNYWIDAGWR
jgi:NAD(P)-dependent dehydrogenase (short-subunit alcohol dehydrogenase family)